MRVAILSAGLSLKQTFDPDAHFDLRIGVNAAAAVYCCDWWCCGDAQTFARVQPVGFPVLFTITDSDGNFRPARIAERLDNHRMVLWSKVAKEVHAPAPWNTQSIMASLMLAVHQRATRVHVYGHDMSGTLDVDGFDLPVREKHWSTVRINWNTMKAWASDRGVKVIEHQPEQVPAGN